MRRRNYTAQFPAPTSCAKYDALRGRTQARSTGLPTARRWATRWSGTPPRAASSGPTGAPLGGGFALNVFLRDGRRWPHPAHRRPRHEQLSPFARDVLPYGRQEDWQDSPAGWPQSSTYDKWLSSEEIAALYGAGATA